MVEMQIVQCGGHVHVRVPGLPGRLLAKVVIGDRTTREAVNEALDRAEARLLFDEGRRTCGRPSVEGSWLTNGDRAQDVHVSRAVGELVSELERAEAKAAEAQHQATAQRLYDEGWRLGPSEGIAVRTESVQISGCEFEALRKIQEAPETQPRWTMTKRQRDAYKKSYTSVGWQDHQKRWGMRDELSTDVFYGDVVAPHDCHGMRENGPVVFLSSSAAESRAARKVGRPWDYMREHDQWYIWRSRSWWPVPDPGLL